MGSLHPLIICIRDPLEQESYCSSVFQQTITFDDSCADILVPGYPGDCFRIIHYNFPLFSKLWCWMVSMLWWSHSLIFKRPFKSNFLLLGMRTNTHVDFCLYDLLHFTKFALGHCFLLWPIFFQWLIWLSILWGVPLITIVLDIIIKVSGYQNVFNN